SPDCTVLKANRLCMPRIQPQKPTAMNRPILVLVTGTPTARAAFASPPEAKIQLPTLVRSSTQDARATRMIQMTTVIRTSTPLTNPMPRDTTSAKATPTQMFVLKYQENMDAERAEVMTATPVERSNSPPIISKATPTAMMPIVELP